MCLLRAFATFCCLVVSVSADAADIDDWIAESQASRESRFQVCLKDFEEAALEPLARDRSVEVYRMVYLPSFYPQVLMRVNIWPTGDGRLTMRSIPPYCGDRDPPIEQKQVGLTTAEIATLRDGYARYDFWRRVKVEGRDGADGVESVICSDGATIYFEAVRDGRYHRVSRNCLWVRAIENLKGLFHRLARTKDPHRRD
jgi:hypothetical protein